MITFPGLNLVIKSIKNTVVTLYPCLVMLQYSDMNEEMRVETMELCVTACEKFSANNEVCLSTASLHVWFTLACIPDILDE